MTERLYFHFPLHPASVLKNPVQVGRAFLMVQQTVEHAVGCEGGGVFSL